MLYFSHPQIVLQEVPNEISLALSISGCPLKCKGCHSSFTWNSQYGEELTDDKLNDLINKNQHITCVLFYGGEWNTSRLIELIKIVKFKNLKIALYTGLNLNDVQKDLLQLLNYIKVGRFVQELGGLNSKMTNQKMYNLSTMEDITYYFQRT